MAVYDRDYLTTLPLLYEKASEYSGGDWNKYNDDVGDTILKLLAASSHTVDYYFRKFLTSLVLPNDDWDQKALIWELTGYKPNYVRADYLMVQLYWPDCGLDSYVPIYQYTPFKITADGKEYTFLCAQDYILIPLTTRANIRLVNGELVTIEQDYTQIKNNKIKLSDDDLDYDLVTVVVSGTKWTQVRNVFYSPDTERIFSVHKESDGIYVYLHSTWQEYVDSYDTSFVIYFVQSRYDFSMYTDECMTVSFGTEIYSFDGDDVSSFYQIIPLLNSDDIVSEDNLMPSTTEGNRAITVLDFEANAALFPGIVSSRAYDWNTPEVCRDPFEVVMIACDSDGNLSEHMKQVLKSYLESITSPILNVRVIAPVLAKQDILVLVDIGDYKGTLAEKEIKKTVEMALEDFYKIGNLPPGRIVKTKELNSLLLHSDSRIYFATTSFLNPQVRSPYYIPVLGTVVVITSAEAFTYYDYGKGFDKGYVGLTRYDWVASKEKVDDVNLFISRGIRANIIVPIDKLPLELFDSVSAEEESPLFYIGSGEMPAAEFGYGDGFVHIFESGGDPAGPGNILVYETDGSSVLTKCERNITNVVRPELRFENGFGSFFAEPYISIDVKHDDIEEIKGLLAYALNTLPGLTDGDGNPFDITGEDIYFPYDTIMPPDKETDDDTNEETQLGGNREEVPLSRVYPLGNGGSAGLEEDAVDVSEQVISNERNTIEINDSVTNTDSGDSALTTERQFVYIPYNNSVLREIVSGKEKSDVQKINFIIKTREEHEYKNYLNFEYNAEHGNYQEVVPYCYGRMSYLSCVELSITDKITELFSKGPEVYSETASYGSKYYVREKDGNPLTWYFVNTSPVHSVGGTHEIGYGIYVGFVLLRDSSVYVEADAVTSRGFIYSSEMQIDDFNVADSPEE